MTLIVNSFVLRPCCVVPYPASLCVVHLNATVTFYGLSSLGSPSLLAPMFAKLGGLCSEYVQPPPSLRPPDLCPLHLFSINHKVHGMFWFWFWCRQPVHIEVFSPPENDHP